MKIEKWKMLGYGVARMQWDEILDRTRQAMRKRSDAAFSRVGIDFRRKQIARTSSVPGEFFFAPESVETILALVRERLPGRAEQIIEEAEEIRHHRFRLLGYSDLDYGHRIDWHLDAVHRKRVPKRPFYRLRYLEFAECGDAKVIWDLNRHQHFVTLAKAYRLTGDRRYLDELLRQKQHWDSENPYPMGINWVSSLEVAFRSLSWLWTLSILCGSPGTPDLRREWLPALALHGRHIERYLSTYFSPNTHLLGEALALFFLGVLCPELSSAESWKSLGWKILNREAGRQVRSDGFYFEQSTHYHVYALDFFLHAAVLAAMNSVPVPEDFRETVRRMSEALFLLSRSGPPPQFGDDDGGRLFDPRRNQSVHMLDPLSTAAVLFDRGDFKHLAHDLREETLWLLGEQGVRKWDALRETKVSRQSDALREGGCYVLATASTQLIADAGPLGAYSGGHGHADALSVCMQMEGHSLLIDPGTSQYVGAGVDRASFRGTAMHNTVQLDGLDQAEVGDIFSWRRLPLATVEHWIQAPSCDLFVGYHDGYRRLQQPVTHRRWIVSLKNGAYLIRDVVDGSQRHQIDVAWHLGRDLRLEGDYVFRVKHTPHTLTFLPARRPGWTEQLDTQLGSPAYGRKARMNVLKFHANVVLPAEFAILLIASEQNARIMESFRWSEHSGPALSEYRYSTAGVEYSFIFNETGNPWHCRTLLSDAKYVCHRSSPETSEQNLFLCDGSYARIGELDLCCSRRVKWAEVNLGENGETVSCSDRSALLAPRLPVVPSRQATFHTR